MKFHKRLKRLRENAGLPRSYIAQALNITSNGYGNYEIGRSEPNIDTLIKIADILHLSIDELLGHEVDQIQQIISRLKLLGFRVFEDKKSNLFYILSSTKEDNHYISYCTTAEGLLATYNMALLVFFNDTTHIRAMYIKECILPNTKSFGVIKLEEDEVFDPQNISSVPRPPL